MELTRQEIIDLYRQGFTPAQIVDTVRRQRAEADSIAMAQAPAAPPLGPRGQSGFAYTGTNSGEADATMLNPLDALVSFIPGPGQVGAIAPMAAKGAATAAPVLANKVIGPAAELAGDVAGGFAKGLAGRFGGAGRVAALAKMMAKRFGKPKPRVRAKPKPSPKPKAESKPQPKSGVTQNKSPVQQRGATKAQLERRQADLAARRTPDDLESKLVGSLALRRPGLESLTHDQKVLLGRLVAQGDEEALAMLQRFVGQ